MRVRLLLLITVSFGCLTGAAYAQSDDERARTHFEAGRSYYDQARYDDASREFMQAFELSQRPEMLLNLSQAQERALRYYDAISSARRYLQLVPAAEDRKTIEDRIVNLEKLKIRLEAGMPPEPLEPPGGFGPDGEPAAAPETPADPATAPADPEQPEPPPTAAAPEAKPAPPAATAQVEAENRFTVPAIVLMGTGGAALVGALVTGLVAHADYKSLERRCAPNGDCPPAAQDELDEGETLSVLSTVLTVIGVVAAGTGGALLVIGANETDEAEAARPGQLSLGPGPTPLSASASLRF